MAAREIRLFLTAWVFFTRIPLPGALARWTGYTPDMLRDSARHFPLVGLCVGAIGAAVYLLAVRWWAPTIAVLLSMAATLLATGAFHEDGFADSCDGFGGGYTPGRVLEIMADSRIGAFGAIGIGLMLALKAACLVSLADGGDDALVAWLLVAGHALSRAGSVALMLALDYVRRDDGPKAKPLAEKISAGGFAVSLVWALLPLAGIARAYEGGHWMFVTVLPVAAAAWLAGAYFRRRIGGFTGDCLGAAQQVCEVVFYLAALAVIDTEMPLEEEEPV